MTKCKVKNCIRESIVYNFCRAHYERFKKGKNLNTPIKITIGKRKYKKCTIINCNRTHRGHGYCQAHLHRFKKGLNLYTPIREFGKGTINPCGYKILFINGHSIPEHRLIMEKHLKRKLKKSELVHHINGNRLDNNIKNLQLFTKGEHISYHHTGIPKPKKHNYLKSINTQQDWYNRGKSIKVSPP